jgi:hypothetical protein
MNNILQPISKQLNKDERKLFKVFPGGHDRKVNESSAECFINEKPVEVSDSDAPCISYLAFIPQEI